MTGLIASPAERDTCTPATRCRASPTVLSGSLPMSCATMESTKPLAFSLISCALIKLLRTSETTNVSSFTVSSPAGAGDAGAAAGAGAAGCANAVVIDKRNASTEMAPERFAMHGFIKAECTVKQGSDSCLGEGFIAVGFVILSRDRAIGDRSRPIADCMQSTDVIESWLTRRSQHDIRL